MLKQTVQYKDYDDNDAVDTLYFNITKTELSENLELTQRFQALKDLMEGERRDYTMSEIQLVLDLVKEVMRLAYGIKSADGKKFSKSPEVWKSFTEEAVYDAFLFSLFENPQKANDFLVGVFPQDLLAAAQAQIESGVAPQVIENAEIRVAPEVAEKDPREMTREELLAAFQKKSQAE